MTWIGGLAEWEIGDTTYLSVAFTWKLDEAHARAQFARALGRRVVVGGPALFQVKMQHRITDVAEYEAIYPDAIARHNPEATMASRGCPGRGTEDNPLPCTFCIVPAMEGRRFTYFPEFPVRPVLCDNNLSALPAAYQDYIIGRYVETGTPLKDANSGFEPVTFSEEVYRRWKPLLNAGGGPWRFGYDQLEERTDVLRVMRMLKDEPQRRKRVYVLIGNEPFAACMERIEETIAMGCEPHVQPYMKLNALERRPHPRHDWNEQLLRDVARWANGFVWRSAPFSEYDRHRKNVAAEYYDQQQGLFV
jgi:hypothetical protein